MAECPAKLQLNICGKETQTIDSLESLGVILDSKLTLEHQVTNIHCKQKLREHISCCLYFHDKMFQKIVNRTWGCWESATLGKRCYSMKGGSEVRCVFKCGFPTVVNV